MTDYPNLSPPIVQSWQSIYRFTAVSCPHFFITVNRSYGVSVSIFGKTFKQSGEDLLYSLRSRRKLEIILFIVQCAWFPAGYPFHHTQQTKTPFVRPCEWILSCLCKSWGYILDRCMPLCSLQMAGVIELCWRFFGQRTIEVCQNTPHRIQKRSYHEGDLWSRK